MKAYIDIGANREFKLREAVLVYRTGGDGAFASLHKVEQSQDGAPYLAAGELLNTAFVRTLAEGLGARVKPEILPDNILARTPDLLVWWSRPQCRVMFFGGTDEQARKLNGLVLPHPALVFKVAGRDLSVRALATTSRPAGNSPLKTAPYWNTDNRGLVCPGTMRVPESSDVSSIPQWQAAYFQSNFTHAVGAVRLTNHPGGFIGLWRSLANRKRFAVRYLTDAGETLEEFVARGADR
ncbi:MAG: PRTRC system protein B [Acidobacteria bacterium]|nr:MAG: PRTRC system protein B [Acidobacteriota bacterium]